MMLSAKTILASAKARAEAGLEMLKSAWGWLTPLVRRSVRRSTSEDGSRGEGGISSTIKVGRTKTALGVDISDKQVSIALLKKGENGVELLASAGAPVPDGAIKNGHLEDAAVLANAIRGLKNSSRIRATNAVISLFTEPVITQILDIPKQVPSNIGQFVREQVKHIAALPTNNIALDFCGVAGAGSETSPASRLFVVATDSRKVDELVKVGRQAGLIVEAIEPPLLAYIRALYAKKIAGKFDNNVLIAVLQASTLNLCVFRRQTMDFVRTRSISKEKMQPNEFCQWLAEQMNMVIQFYDVEVPDSSGKWEVTVVAGSEIIELLPQSAQDALKAKVVSVASANLRIMTDEDICQDAVVSQPRPSQKGEGQSADSQRAGKPSPVAIGLAMKLLDTDARNLGVNLLPPPIVRVRAARKEALITANIIAAVLLIMILGITGPAWKIQKLNEDINKKAYLLRDIPILVRKRASINKQISDVSSELNRINDISDSYYNTYWPDLLNDIGNGIPGTVRITSLSGKADSGMSLKGLALSNEAVYLFVDTLGKSEYIDSVSVAEAKRDNKGFVSYEINCVLASGKESSDAN